ncbi:MAG: restriction endonuclease subunit S [Hormoscilla sp. SP5CHS1]|nr:restriction endonuclease subunit S [Hormoscilla sp. SP5CHS1]
MSKHKLAIDNIQVPEGYQKTEVGVIPEDWDVQALSEMCVKIQDGTHFSPSLGGNDYLYITSKNLGREALKISNAERIDAIQHRAIYSRCDVRKGDLLLTKDGVNTGNAALNHLNEEFSLLSSVAFLRFNTKKYDPSYFLQQILSSDGQNRIKELMSGNAITRLTLEKIRRIQFSVPPLKEQRAIAQTLSDVDGLIAALDKLIAKKRNIKTATMQELLIGKKRLPGFHGEWEMKLLGEMGVTYGGLNGKTKADFGTGSSQYIPFLNIINNVVVDPDDIKTVKVSISENQNQVKMGDLFFNGSSETPEKVGMCAVLLTTINHVYLNSFCFGFRLHDDLEADGLFLAYFFRSNEGRKLLYTLAQGTTRYNLSKTNFMKLKLKIPTPQEQRAIATILSDMDAEIAALEKRRAKTKAMKQGMMQELLTGKTRLINPNNPCN